jgi:hypothetical protein
MIVIDTNIASELMRDAPDHSVLAWSASAGHLHTTALTVAEIEYGIARLPAGSRREQLAAASAQVFADFGDFILPFDARAARRYARIVAGRQAMGRPIGMADAQIAAICAGWQATLATRNTGDFDGTGIAVVNPWQELTP